LVNRKADDAIYITGQTLVVDRSGEGSARSSRPREHRRR
jgi:hypothetical protein